MSVGGGNTVSFGLKAIADLKGINDTSKALTDLSAKGGQAGQGIGAGMDGASSKLDAFRSKAQSVQSELGKISAVGLVVGGGIAAGLGIAVKTFADFQHEMNAVQSVTGATGDQFKQLSALALKIGRDTVFSSSEAATAIEELAKAGVGVGDILNGAAAGATALAAAAGEGIPEAAVQIANTLNEFGLAGSQATHVADVFANVANKSAADATSFGESLTYVGGQAHALGVPLEDVGAAIAVLADQGIQGSLAGTSLGDAMIRLAKPTSTAKELMAQTGIVVKDAKGNFVGLTEIIQEVAKATENMGNVERTEFLTKIFGIQGARAMNALLNTQTDAAKAAGKSWEDYSTAVRVNGTAQEQAQARMAGLTGAFKQLSGSFELAQIEIGGKLAPAIEAVANGITGLLNAFSGLGGTTQSIIAFGLAGVAGLALVAAAGAKIVSVGITTIEVWSKVAGTFTGTGAAGAEAAGGIAVMGDAAAVATPEVAGLAVAEDAAAVGAEGMGVASAASAGGIGAAAASMGALALNLAPVVAGLAAVKLGFDTLDAIQTGGTVGVEGWAEKAGIGLSHGVAAVVGAIPWGGDIADSINKSADDRAIGDALQNVLKKAGFHLDTDFGLKGGLDVQIKELGISVGDFKAAQEASGLSVDDYIKKLQTQAQATADATARQKDQTAATQDQTAATDDQTASLQDQVDQQIATKQAQDQLTKAVQDTLNQQFLASGQFSDWMRPFIVGAKDAQAEAEKLKQGLADTTAGVLNFILGVQDIAPNIDGMQAGFGKVGESIVDIFRHMDDLGALDLSPAVRQALDAASTLDKVQAKIDGVDKAIQQNQGDMSMWQGRIGLVTDAFGANSQTIGEWERELQNGQITQEQFNAAIGTLAGSGGFPKLDALFAQGKISQKEYNDAVNAGTFLLQRSAGGIQDENAELVDNIINLAAYVKAHDDADGAVKQLTASQRGFLAALDDDKVNAFLQHLQLLNSIHADPASIKDFIAAAADADPAIRAVAQDLGLIPKDTKATVTVDTKDAHAKIKDVNDAKVKDKTASIDLKTIDAVGKLKEVEGVITQVTANGKTISIYADTHDAADKFLELNKNGISKLDGKKVVVYVKGDDGEWHAVAQDVINTKIPAKTTIIKADASGANKTIDALNRQKLPDKTVTVTVKTVSAAPPDAGGARFPSTTPSTAIADPPPVKLTADDQITPVIQAVTATLIHFEADAGAAGANAGANFSNDFAAGLNGGVNAAIATAGAVVAALDVGGSMSAMGDADGQNFGIGIANGIAATWNDVFNAAYYVAGAAQAGTQAGMQAHSPSKLALAAGANWGHSVAAGIRGAGANVHAAGRDIAALLPTALANPATSVAMRGILSVDPAQTRAILAGSAARGGATVHHSQTINQTLNFHGITDTAAIVSEVHTQTYRALDRGQAAGLFGS